MERNKLDGNGGIIGTGEYVDYPVQAVYRAIGYFGSELPEIGYDDKRGVITNVEGRVVDENGEVVPGLYASGWIKRGPVGLIGSTKSDALRTITHLLEGPREPLHRIRAGGEGIQRLPGFQGHQVHHLGRLAPPGRPRKHWAQHPRMLPVSLAPA